MERGRPASGRPRRRGDTIKGPIITTLFNLDDPSYGKEPVYNVALMSGAPRSMMGELAAMTAEADKVMVF